MTRAEMVDRRCIHRASGGHILGPAPTSPDWRGCCMRCRPPGAPAGWAAPRDVPQSARPLRCVPGRKSRYVLDRGGRRSTPMQSRTTLPSRSRWQSGRGNRDRHEIVMPSEQPLLRDAERSSILTATPIPRVRWGGSIPRSGSQARSLECRQGAASLRLPPRSPRPSATGHSHAGCVTASLRPTRSRSSSWRISPRGWVDARALIRPVFRCHSCSWRNRLRG